MKTVTVRDLRNQFSKIEAWLEEGEKIQVKKRGQAIAVISGIHGASGRRAPQKPDFRARLNAIWGPRVFSQAEVDAMRSDELQGEEG